MKPIASLMLAGTGVMGLVLTIVSMIEGSETGAGLLLAGAAIAFGFLGLIHRHEAESRSSDTVATLRGALRAMQGQLAKAEQRLTPQTEAPMTEVEQARREEASAP